jgi:hypothetical protein
VLVVSQVSLTLLLLIGASLLTETFVRLRTQNTGFASDGLIVVRATNYRTGSRQEQAAALSQFHERVLERVRGVPGVIAAGGTNVLPYTRATPERTRAQLIIRGAAAEDTRLQLPLSGADVSPGYLETMGIQLLAGRSIDARDTTDSPMVVLVNERAAKALWPNRNPIGQQVYWGSDTPSPSNPYCTVVGVVSNVRHLAGERDEGWSSTTRTRSTRSRTSTTWSARMAIPSTSSHRSATPFSPWTAMRRSSLRSRSIN